MNEEPIPLPAKVLGGMPPVPALGQMYGDAKKENTDAMAEVTAAKDASSKARLAGKEKVAGIQAGAPTPPPLEKLPDEFKHKGMNDKEMTDTLQTMFVFAALGGAMTRTPMTTAIKAFGGAMEGLVKGDQISFQREAATFDKNLKLAMTKNSEAMQKYKLAFEKHKGDLGAAMQEIQLEAAAHNDTVTGALARANNAKAIMSQIQAMQRTEATMQQAQKKMEQTAATAAARDAQRHAEAMARIDQGNQRLAETVRHNQAGETNTANRNATYRQRIEGAGQQGLKGKAADAFVHNESNAEALTDVLKQIEENPDAFGFKTLMPGIVLNRMDSDGTPVRAALANITSMTIKDRAGTAQTASEMKNIAPFIPRDGDDVETVKTKIKGMITEMARMNKHLAGGAPRGGDRRQPPTAPAMNEEREIDGVPAVWDGKGWLPKKAK